MEIEDLSEFGVFRCNCLLAEKIVQIGNSDGSNAVHRVYDSEGEVARIEFGKEDTGGSWDLSCSDGTSLSSVIRADPCRVRVRTSLDVEGHVIDNVGSLHSARQGNAASQIDMHPDRIELWSEGGPETERVVCLIDSIGLSANGVIEASSGLVSKHLRHRDQSDETLLTLDDGLHVSILEKDAEAPRSILSATKSGLSMGGQLDMMDHYITGVSFVGDQAGGLFFKTSQPESGPQKQLSFFSGKKEVFRAGSDHVTVGVPLMPDELLLPLERPQRSHAGSVFVDAPGGTLWFADDKGSWKSLQTGPWAVEPDFISSGNRRIGIGLPNASTHALSVGGSTDLHGPLIVAGSTSMSGNLDLNNNSLRNADRICGSSAEICFPQSGQSPSVRFLVAKDPTPDSEKCVTLVLSASAAEFSVPITQSRGDLTLSSGNVYLNGGGLVDASYVSGHGSDVILDDFISFRIQSETALHVGGGTILCNLPVVVSRGDMAVVSGDVRVDAGSVHLSGDLLMRSGTLSGVSSIETGSNSISLGDTGVNVSCDGRKVLSCSGQIATVHTGLAMTGNVISGVPLLSNRSGGRIAEIYLSVDDAYPEISFRVGAGTEVVTITEEAVGFACTVRPVGLSLPTLEPEKESGATYFDSETHDLLVSDGDSWTKFSSSWSHDPLQNKTSLPKGTSAAMCSLETEKVVVGGTAISDGSVIGVRLLETGGDSSNVRIELADDAEEPSMSVSFGEAREQESEPVLTVNSGSVTVRGTLQSSSVIFPISSSAVKPADVVEEAGSVFFNVGDGRLHVFDGEQWIRV